MTYYFWYDPATGQLWPASQVKSGVPVPPGWGIPLDAQEIAWATTDTPSADAVWWQPQAYRVVNGQIVPVAYWTVAQSTASGTTTLTATLANPPSTPPASGTATIGQTTLTLPITSGTMTLAVQPHPSLAAYTMPIQLTAAGTVAATAMVGEGPPAPVGLQAVAPAASGDPYLIAPTGPGSKAFLAQWALGDPALPPAAAQAVLDLVGLLAPILTAVATVTPPGTWTGYHTAWQTWQAAQAALPHLA